MTAVNENEVTVDLSSRSKNREVSTRHFREFVEKSEQLIKMLESTEFVEESSIEKFFEDLEGSFKFKLVEDEFEQR